MYILMRVCPYIHTDTSHTSHIQAYCMYTLLPIFNIYLHTYSYFSNSSLLYVYSTSHIQYIFAYILILLILFFTFTLRCRSWRF